MANLAMDASDDQVRAFCETMGEVRAELGGRISAQLLALANTAAVWQTTPSENYASCSPAAASAASCAAAAAAFGL